MPRIAITGASGMLGQALCHHFLKQDHWQIHAQWHSTAIHQAELNPVRLDLSNSHATQAWLADIQPDVIIHCAALTHLKTCESNISKAIAANVTSGYHLAQFCHNQGIKLVAISTDAVYPDHPELKSEDLPTAPQNLYGLTKLWGEDIIRMSAKNHFIARTTIIGHGPGQLLSWLIAQAEKGEEIRLFEDVWFSPISVDLLAPLLQKAIEQDLQGTYNLAGSDRLSKADFGRQVINRVNPQCPWRGGSITELSPQVKRCHNMALDSQRFAQVADCRLPTASESIESLLKAY